MTKKILQTRQRLKENLTKNLTKSIPRKGPKRNGISKRSTERKQHFYQLLAANLKQALQIRPEDLMVSIIENGDADWSFGMGEAQLNELFERWSV